MSALIWGVGSFGTENSAKVYLHSCQQLAKAISGNTSHFITFRGPELRFAIRPQ
jgi:hypothetical protein